MKFVMPSVIVVAALMSAGPAFAPNLRSSRIAICMHVYGEKIGERMDCTFNSLDQCTATASGLPATCLINPYYARMRGPGRRLDNTGSATGSPSTSTGAAEAIPDIPK